LDNITLIVKSLLKEILQQPTIWHS